LPIDGSALVLGKGFKQVVFGGVQTQWVDVGEVWHGYFRKVAMATAS